jgi:L,D-transpeptidase ErfK/SrfK
MRFSMNFYSRRPLTRFVATGLLFSLASGAMVFDRPAAIAQSAPAAAPVTTPVPAAPAPALTQPLTAAPGNVVTPTTPAPVVAPTPAVAPSPAAPSLLPAPQAENLRLVLKRSQRRVFVYKDDKVISSYPVAVGKPGWETPLGEFKVLTMELNPIFKSFKTGRVIPPGLDNPLGVRWIGIWTDGETQLGFHGTNEPELIGQAVSHGCIRMLNKDVVKLYAQVKNGTPVQVVP